MSAESLRVFVALSINPEVGSAYNDLAGRISSGTDLLKVIPFENAHLTLRFIGEVGQDQITAIKQAIDTMEGTGSQIDVSWARLGMFKNSNTLWLGPHKGDKDIDVLHHSLEHSLRAAGFSPETRIFRPHITIARFEKRKPQAIRAAREICDSNMVFQPLRIRFESVILCKSTLGGPFPKYEPIHSRNLGS